MWQETQRNRQMISQILSTIFASQIGDRQTLCSSQNVSIHLRKQTPIRKQKTINAKGNKPNNDNNNSRKQKEKMLSTWSTWNCFRICTVLRVTLLCAKKKRKQWDRLKFERERKEPTAIYSPWVPLIIVNAIVYLKIYLMFLLHWDE